MSTTASSSHSRSESEASSFDVTVAGGGAASVVDLLEPSRPEPIRQGATIAL